MKLAISFTNIGPYHLARLRALGQQLHGHGGRLIAYETAGLEQKVPLAGPARRGTVLRG